MKSLIVEDDFAARRLMQIYLAGLGGCDVAINGLEAVKVVKEGIEDGETYDLVCLDIMMPQMDGMETLRRIRQIEKDHGIEGLGRTKIIMTTAKNLSRDIFEAFNKGCESYLVKPVKKEVLLEEIKKLGLIEPSKEDSSYL